MLRGGLLRKSESQVDGPALRHQKISIKPKTRAMESGSFQSSADSLRAKNSLPSG